MLLAEFLDSFDDLRITARVSHCEGGVVGMGTSSIPISLHWLRMKRHDHLEVLSHSLQEETGNPQLVTAVDSDAGTHLVFPLSSHHLCISSTNVDSGVKAGSVVSLHDLPAICSSRAVSAVVWSLR